MAGKNDEKFSRYGVVIFLRKVTRAYNNFLTTNIGEKVEKNKAGMRLDALFCVVGFRGYGKIFATKKQDFVHNSSQYENFP